MILADTSIWIDYLRGQNDLLAQYIQQGANDPYKFLKTTLKAEIDEEA